MLEVITEAVEIEVEGEEGLAVVGGVGEEEHEKLGDQDRI